ncbi:MAG: ABC transporter permease subunit [Thermoplasmata archaeon]|nr:ABC transporter permease subunit [Thermoplasmata archaeon]
MRPRSVAGLLPLGLFLLAFGLLPAVLLLGGALEAQGGASAWWGLLGSPLDRAAIWNSLTQGALSALLATALGYPAGVFLGRWHFPGRSLALAFLPVPFLLPSLLVLLGLAELLGPSGLLGGPLPGLETLDSGLPGILLVNLLFNAPIVALLTATAVRGSAAEQEEAAELLGATPARVYREVWGPLSLLGAAAGALLTFLFSALAFAAPLILCGPRCFTIEDRVFFLAQVLAEPHAAALLALWAVALFATPTAFYALLLRSLRRREGHRRRVPLPLSRGGWRPAPLLLATALLFGGELLLLGSVLYRALLPAPGGTGSGWTELFGATVTDRLGISTAQVLGNTFLFASLAAGIVLLLAIGAGFAYRSAPRASAAMGGLLFLPLLVSPVLLAFSLATFWRPLLGGANSVWVLIVVSQAIAALPLSVPPVLQALSRLTRSATEAARTLGARPLTAYLDVELPQALRGLGSAALLALAIGLGEFTATYFLYLPRFTTLPVELYLLQGARQFSLLPALGGVLLVVSLLAFVGVELGGRWIVR